MTNKNSVMFKGSRDGIIILLNEEEDFETIKEQFAGKVKDAKRFFEGAKAAISFRGRNLTETEEKQLLEIIASSTDLNISFVNTSQPVPSTMLSAIKMADETVTSFYTTGLRSGQTIRYDGSVVVMGDVNPGAQIVASGNIIVLGAARGLLFAGCNGRTTSFIYTYSLWPIQLRIADVISQIPDEYNADKKEKPVPTYAYLKEGKMYIEQLPKI